VSKRQERKVSNRVGVHYLHGLRFIVVELRRELPTKLHAPLRWYTTYQVQDRWSGTPIGEPSENRERVEKLARRCNREGRPC
jgi:hypothetical protein